MTTACGDLSWISGKGKEMNGGGEGRDSRALAPLKLFASRCIWKQHRAENSGVSLLEFTGSPPIPPQKQSEPMGVCAPPPPAQMAATQARHPEGTCWELLSREPVTRVRDTFLEQRGNYLAHTSL